MPSFIGEMCAKHNEWAEDGTGFEEEPKGWHALLEELFDAIGAAMAQFPGKRIEVRQVKQKLGGLCFYYDAGQGTVLADLPLEPIRAAIERAEALSFHTCEVCGGRGRLRMAESRLLSTRCETHAREGSRPISEQPPRGSFH